MSVIYGNIVGGAGSNGSGVETINGIVTSTNADYAEVGEWSDGNPDGEDRIGYFVAVDTSEPGKTMIKATTDSDVRGVTISKPAFAANASKDKYGSDGNLLPQFDYVCFAGFASVIDNGLCSVNGRCMPAADGTAEPSTNDFGYQVIERIDDTKVLVLVEPQADMTARIKDDISKLSDDIASYGRGKFQYISYSYVGEAATNSLEHFRWCAANDYDGIKCDVRVTSDSKLVLCHDAGYTFDDNGRITSYDTSNCTLIRDMTYDEVMSKEFHNYYNGSYCHPTDLETFLEICKEAGKIAYITIRDQYMDEIAPAVVSAIEKYGMVNCSIINSFTMESLSYVRTLNKNLYLSLVIDPFTESERATAYEYATENRNCMICLYYTNGGHTISELAADSSVMEFLSQCLTSGIRFYGAKCADVADTDTLLALGFSGVQTKVNRPSGESLNLSTLTMETVSGEDSTTLILKDTHQNVCSAEIPKMTPTDAQVQAGVESWMDKNATPTEVWSKNVLNVNDTDVSMGYIASAGQINSSDTQWVSGFIPVQPGDVVRSSLNGAAANFYFIAEYDSGKGFLTRASGSADTYTVANDGAVYIRVSWKTSLVPYQSDAAMLTLNNSDLTFEAYGSHIEGSLAQFLVLESQNGTKYTISVNDDGTLYTTLA